MMKYMVPILFTLSAVGSYTDVPHSHFNNPSAASSAQINFAIENKYDDTGPGAKKPEYAYNTYKNLDDALIAYLDDPDTKLPEHERDRAVQKLIAKSQLYGKPGWPAYYHQKQTNYLNKGFPKTHFPHNPLPSKYLTNNGFFSDNNKVLLSEGQFQNDFISNSPVKHLEPFKLQKFQSVKGIPLNMGHYTREPGLKTGFDQFESFPKQSYSLYNTGDLSHNAETRNAGVTHGYYTFLESDGKHRTVHYTNNVKH